MKKLKLRLAGKEMLSKEQMKRVSGGYDGNCYTCQIAIIGCTINGHNYEYSMTGYYGCAYVLYYESFCEFYGGYYNGYCDCPPCV